MNPIMILEAIKLIGRLSEIYQELEEKIGKEKMASFVVSLESAVKKASKATSADEKYDSAKDIVNIIGSLG